ncbi:MAG: hypothetical protein KF904_00080 [Rhodoblastus sp.]|nr:hypothetical protein [Rhodoblastus sp.]
MAGENDTKAPTQTFTTIFGVVTGTGSVEAGKKIKLTREEFDELKALGAIDGEWSEKAKAAS